MLQNNKHIKDFWIRFIFSILISFFFVFLGADSFSLIINGKHFYTDLLIAFLLTFITTSYISRVNAYLDKNYSWETLVYTRLIYQMITCILLPVLFYIFLMYIYLAVFLKLSPGDVQFFHTELPISILLVFFWNFVHVSFSFISKHTHQKEEISGLKNRIYTLENISTTESITSQMHANIDVQQSASYNENAAELISPLINNNQSKKFARILIAASGNKNIPIPLESIAYFYKSGNLITLKTFQQETFLLNHTLEDLSKTLDERIFFRANRQFLIHINSCQFFTLEENGKLELNLTPIHNESVIISQKKALAFKEWLNQQL